jgi:SAM-dependent methyltransferase
MKTPAIINKDSLEYTPCPLCGADQPNEHQQFVFTPFRVVPCLVCQLWYLSPRLREAEMLKAYADPNYFKGGGEHGYSRQQGSYLDQELSLRLTFKRFIQQLQQHGMTGGHLLEIGCGYGFLLEAAAPFFESLTGTDFDKQALARIQLLGYHGIHGGVNDLPVQQRYDLIVATGVIEHIYQPLPFVKQLGTHLNPHGWMVFATPQMNSFWLKLQGPHWPSFKIPEHVTYYDQHTLTDLFRRSGATQTLILPYPHAYPLGMVGEKLGLSLPKWVAKYSLWLPATMFAVAARL